jgi:hypothetical protein
MSTTPRSTVQASREQLDELDALLQRMLDVTVEPVADPEAPSAVGAVGPVDEAPAMVDMPSLTTVSSPGGQKRPVLARVRPDEKTFPAYRTESDPTKAEGQTARRAPQAPAPSAPAVITPSATPAPPVEGPTIKILQPGTTAPAPLTTEKRISDHGSPAPGVSPATSVEPPLVWWQWPLGWLNLPFDYLASRLGSPGRWARQPNGRRILGWIGVGLLGIAVFLLILDWIGWPP